MLPNPWYEGIHYTTRLAFLCNCGNPERCKFFIQKSADIMFKTSNACVSSITGNIENMGGDARKPVFGASNQVRLKPICCAAGNSYDIKMLHEASLDIANSKGTDQAK